MAFMGFLKWFCATLPLISWKLTHGHTKLAHAHIHLHIQQDHKSWDLTYNGIHGLLEVVLRDFALHIMEPILIFRVDQTILEDSFAFVNPQSVYICDLVDAHRIDRHDALNDLCVCVHVYVCMCVCMYVGFTHSCLKSMYIFVASCMLAGSLGLK
jgi:hypothetical protein